MFSFDTHAIGWLPPSVCVAGTHATRRGIFTFPHFVRVSLIPRYERLGVDLLTSEQVWFSTTCLDTQHRFDV